MSTRRQPTAPRPLDEQTRDTRATANAGEPTLEFAEATPYEAYVGVRQLQALVAPVTDHPAEPAFLVITQVMELLFTLLRREWELAQRKLRADDLDAAVSALRRSVHDLQALNATWGALSWLSPADFNGFRDELGEASGFQSYEYRHVELARRGLPIPAAVLDRDRSVTHPADAAVTDVWTTVYRDPRPGNELFVLAETLTDVAEEFTVWRQRHVTAVKRSMGAKPGSGGSAGLAWLERSAAREVFPDLWAARTQA